MENIWLVDTNAPKEKNSAMWLRHLQRSKKFSELKKKVLKCAEIETMKNYALLEQPNVYTVFPVNEEFETFYEKVEQEYLAFMKPIKRLGQSLNGPAKDNERTLKNILERMEDIKKQMENSVYDFSQHQTYNFFYELVRRDIVRKHNRGQYSEADRLLVAGPLTRAAEGLETHVLTPDRGIRKITEEALQQIESNNPHQFYNPKKLIEKIKLFNTYSGEIKEEQLCA